MQSSKVGRNEIWYDNAEEFYELKKEIFSENCYYLELDKEEPVILDLGAHIGMTVIYFKMLFPGAKITAYEPIPANFKLLKQNVEENQLENVTLVQAAVAPKSGQIILQEPTGEGAWTSGAGIIPGGWRGVQTNKKIMVTAVGIQQVLSKPIDLLKMDIEGMEYEVVRNMGSKIRNIKRMVIEVHPRRDHRAEEIKKTLLQNGFEIEIREDRSNLGKGLSKIWAVLK